MRFFFVAFSCVLNIDNFFYSLYISPTNLNELKRENILHNKYVNAEKEVQQQKNKIFA